MNADDLRRHLREMDPKETFSLPYDIYEGIFPPSDPLETSREACAAMARDCGCTVTHDTDAQQVRFTKG